MDDIDRKLLNLLQMNSDLPLSEIAKKVGVSSTPCWNRIKRLEEKGIIKYKISVVDKEKIGYAVTVFLSISVSNHNSNWFTEFEEYDAFQQRLISEIQFTGMSSSISLKEVKNIKQIPL